MVGNVGVLCGIVHGAGNAILMLGGACAAELRLMGLGVGSRCAMLVCLFCSPFVFFLSFCVGRCFGDVIFWILGCIC